MPLLFSNQTQGFYDEKMQEVFAEKGIPLPPDAREVPESHRDVVRAHQEGGDVLLPNGDWVNRFVQFPEQRDAHVSRIALNEAKNILEEIQKWEDGDPEATFTEAEWRGYRVALRAYARRPVGKFPIGPGGRRPAGLDNIPGTGPI